MTTLPEVQARLNFCIELELKELSRAAELYEEFKSSSSQLQILNCMQSIRQLQYVRDNKLYIV